VTDLTTASDYLSRMVVDGTNRQEWLAARARGITATDVAKITDRSSMMVVATKKIMGSPFMGNKYTQHGVDREPVIAAWVAEKFGIESSSALFHAETEKRHLATPDGVSVVDGTVLCAEIKTTKNDWDEIPADYLRQVQWQQYVLGAERTLFAWEPHENFVPKYDEPKFVWIERDEAEIERLVNIANHLIVEIINRTS
jgi:predicted phage-related endonuclease